MYVRSLKDPIGPSANVRVSTVVGGRVTQVRESHNILTNIGRKWLRNLLGGSVYPTGSDPTPVSMGGLSGDARIQYVGIGVGGALQTNAASYTPNLSNTQLELVTVDSIEEEIKVYPASTSPTAADLWLQEVTPQNTTDYFPDDFTIRFEAIFPATAIAFASQATVGGASLGTSVPLSEVGLYLSTADDGLAPSANTSYMVAYNTFSPITITPDVTATRIQWEFRT